MRNTPTPDSSDETAGLSIRSVATSANFHEMPDLGASICDST